MSWEMASGLLACPVCGAPLTLGASSAVCPAGHSFDKARQGYLNLLGRPPANADTAEMVAARARFLSCGIYEPIAQAVAARSRGTTILDVGAGTGYYLAHALDRHTSARGLATDVSVAAARRAAKAHDKMAAVVCDTWAGLPVLSGVIDTVTCVFAPRNAVEFRRVLRPGGALVVAVPLPAHLRSLRDSLGLLGVEPDKQTRLAEAFADGFVPGPSHIVDVRTRLDPDHVRDVVAMGPNAFHGGAHADLPTQPVDVRISVAVMTWSRTSR